MNSGEVEVAVEEEVVGEEAAAGKVLGCDAQESSWRILRVRMLTALTRRHRRRPWRC